MVVKPLICSQPKTLAAPQSVDKSDAEVVICHCMESHRFVVSLHEHVLAEGGTSERPLRLKEVITSVIADINRWDVKVDPRSRVTLS